MLARQMHRARKPFLAAARFTLQQDRHIAIAHALGGIDIRGHLRVAPVQRIERSAARRHGLAARSRARSAGQQREAGQLDMRYGLHHRGEKAGAVACLVDWYRMKRLLRAGIDQAAKGDVEQLRDIAPDDLVAPAQAELGQGATCRRQDLAGDAEGNCPFAQGADEFWTVVKAHDEFVPKLLQEHTVLDHLHRHIDQGQRVLLRQMGFAGRIQYADQLAPMVEDRRGRTGQPDIARQIVLVLVHRHGTLLEQAGAHPIGALHAFAPDRARHQAGPGRRMGKSRVAKVIEQHAVAVGQDDGIAGTGQLLVQVGHLDLGHGLQVGLAFLALLQVGR